MMKEILERVLLEYSQASNSEFKGNQLAQFIRKSPDAIRSATSLPFSYKIQGSPGQGNWAEIPWIGVFDSEVTKSAERGYYIVYLFDADMGGVYLSLNQGYVQYEELYKIKGARKELRRTATKLQDCLRSTLSDFDFAPIDLHAKNNLGKGYELGHICGKYYVADSIPLDSELINDLRNLVGVYRELKGIVGNNILDIKEFESEEEKYQLESGSAELEALPEGPLAKKEKGTSSSSSHWKRSRRSARLAIESSNHICELNPEHETFISRSSGLKFLEVHHLVPMEWQDEFDVDLDVPENIVALCPNCHRLIHLATDDVKIPNLLTLYRAREKGLETRGISIEFEQLLEMY